MVDVPVAVDVQVPLFLAATSTLFGVRLWSTGFWIFWEFPGMFRIQLSLVRQWIRVWCQSTKPFGNLWTLVFLRNAWFDSGFMLRRQTIEAHVQGWFSLSIDISVVVQRQIDSHGLVQYHRISPVAVH